MTNDHAVTIRKSCPCKRKREAQDKSQKSQDRAHRSFNGCFRFLNSVQQLLMPEHRSKTDDQHIYDYNEEKENPGLYPANESSNISFRFFGGKVSFNFYLMSIFHDKVLCSFTILFTTARINHAGLFLSYALP